MYGCGAADGFTADFRDGAGCQDYGMGIGNKGMVVAAKTLAMTAVDRFTDAELLAAAQAEHERRRGPDFEYAPLLGDKDPPLDYRNKP
jgi:aminobenzoyl-glutamate utilization protein B